MANALPQLGRAIRVHAAMVGFALGANDVSSANRASLRHMKLPRAARLVLQHPYNLRDDIAATLHRYPIADAYAQALDLVHIVQRGPAYRGATDGHRLQCRDRC